MARKLANQIEMHMQAERLREILTELGPAFVKIGQVSTGCLQCRLTLCSGEI